MGSPDILACVLSVLLKLLQFPVASSLQQRIVLFLQKLRALDAMMPLMRIESQLAAFYCARSSCSSSFPVDATLIGESAADNSAEGYVKGYVKGCANGCANGCAEVSFTDAFVPLFLQYIAQQTEEAAVAEACLLCLYVVKADAYRAEFLRAGGLEWLKEVVATCGDNEGIVVCVTQCLCVVLKSGGCGGEVRNRRAVDRGGDAVVAVLENGTREGDSGARGATQHSE